VPKAVLALLSNLTGQTLPLHRRIGQRSEFEQVFRSERLINKWFIIHLRKNEIGYARLGMVVSKKAIPKAASRNFAKRLVRDAFRRNFPSDCALDIVVLARRQLNSDNSAEGRLSLMQLFKVMQK
jgi:ribonuclease P protein component